MAGPPADDESPPDINRRGFLCPPIQLSNSTCRNGPSMERLLFLSWVGLEVGGIGVGSAEDHCNGFARPWSVGT